MIMVFIALLFYVGPCQLMWLLAGMACGFFQLRISGTSGTVAGTEQSQQWVCSTAFRSSGAPFSDITLPP